MQKWHLKILVPLRASSVLILGYICGLPKDLLKLQYHMLLLQEPQHHWGEAGHQKRWTWAKPRSGTQQDWSCVQTCSGYSLYICAHTTMRHLLSSDDITNKLSILINWLLNQKSDSTEVHQPRQSLIIFFLLVRKLCPINSLLPTATSQGTEGLSMPFFPLCVLLITHRLVMSSRPVFNSPTTISRAWREPEIYWMATFQFFRYYKTDPNKQNGQGCQAARVPK